MVKVGKVSALFYSPPSGRVKAPYLNVDAKGILSDKHYDKSVERSILIASKESYALALHHNITMDAGLLGENILIEYNPYHLEEGRRVKIGQVTLEISQLCTLCKSLTSIDNKLPSLLKNDRGIFAKVVEIGTIKEGDSVYLLD